MTQLMAVTCEELSVFDEPGSGRGGNEGRDRSWRGFGPSFEQENSSTRVMLLDTLIGLAGTGAGGDSLE